MDKLYVIKIGGNIIDDDKIQRLMSFPNVLITAHQAFFTEEALAEIAEVTLDNISKLIENRMEANSPVMLT